MPPPPEIRSGLISGVLGGLGGAWAGHLIVLALNRLAGTDALLKGPYGPSFFNLALLTSCVYGGIGGGLARRARGAAPGFLAPLLGIAAPLALMTRSAACARLLDPPASWLRSMMPGWYWVVVALLTAWTWIAIFLVGFQSEGPRGGLAACAGAVLAYALFSALLWAAPPLRPQPAAPIRFMPQIPILLDAALTGAGMGWGLSISRRYKTP